MKKILWIVNILFPEAARLLNKNDSFKTSGGWMLASASGLIESGFINLSVISVSTSVKELTILKGKDIIYYIIPSQNNYKKYVSYMKVVNKLVSPDLVHIHGTEFPYGRAWLESCTTDNVVISIQGLISVISRYYLAGLSWTEIIKNITFRDIIRKTIYGEQRDFKRRGEKEIEVIKSVKHIIGRTSFDKAHCLAINSNIIYHFCNETLRSELYSGKWNYDSCTKHSIFLSQSTYPIKGLHLVLRALPIIKKIYPDVCLRIAGGNITETFTLGKKLRLSGYGRIIKRLIQKNDLNENVVFTGSLNAEQMKQEYLNSNLFVCPSSIENSSNSLCEAQLLGVPCLASYVGGTPDLIPNGLCGDLYCYDDIEMLAYKVCRIFDSSQFFDNSEMITMARKRHSPTTNNSALLTIYKEIMKS